MAAEQAGEQRWISKVFFYGTILAGATAAYLMYRRGESLFSIATKAVTNPVGSLVSEVRKTA